MTKAFLIVSVACNVWFLFLLFYDRIMAVVYSFTPFE